MKPVIFIGSSSEAKPLVDIMIQELDEVAEVRPWCRSDIFSLGDYTILRLLKEVEGVDFAILLFSPDDSTTVRDMPFLTARDNVLVEYGISMGLIGVQRTIAVMASNVKVPSDLLGLTVTRYDVERAKTDQAGALQKAIATIRTQISKEGLRSGRNTIIDAADFGGWGNSTKLWSTADDKKVVSITQLTDDQKEAYTISPQMLRVGATIEFEMSIERPQNSEQAYDFRVILFSSSPDVKRSGPSHYCLLVPWGGDPLEEGGKDLRVDFIAADQAHHKLIVPLEAKFVMGQTYHYRISLLSNYVQLDIDNKCRMIYPLDVEGELKRGKYHWGFSTYKSSISIRGLKTSL